MHVKSLTTDHMEITKMTERLDQEQEQIMEDYLYRKLIGQQEYDLEQFEKGDINETFYV